ESVADGPVFHESETASPPAQGDGATNAAEAAEEGSNPDAPAPGEADDSSRPKRSGWWRRARATLVGE
ncbi:MAG: hypothetical protein ACLQE9_09250, partial [Roseiarcus sp.]